MNPFFAKFMATCGLTTPAIELSNREILVKRIEDAFTQYYRGIGRESYSRMRKEASDEFIALREDILPIPSKPEQWIENNLVQRYLILSNKAGSMSYALMAHEVLHLTKYSDSSLFTGVMTSVLIRESIDMSHEWEKFKFIKDVQPDDNGLFRLLVLEKDQFSSDLLVHLQKKT
jgi:hypothetical protein